MHPEKQGGRNAIRCPRRTVLPTAKSLWAFSLESQSDRLLEWLNSITVDEPMKKKMQKFTHKVRRHAHRI